MERGRQPDRDGRQELVLTSGDEAEFTALYEEIGPGLRSFLRVTLGDSALADDVLQEAFYRFLRADIGGLNRFQAKSYLYKTASTLVADHFRSRARQEGRIAGEFGSNAMAATPEIEIDVPRLFAKLPLKQRTLLWLAYVEDLPHREIAASTGLKERSVRVTLSRARRMFGDVLRKAGWTTKEG